MCASTHATRAHGNVLPGRTAHVCHVCHCGGMAHTAHTVCVCHVGSAAMWHTLPTYARVGGFVGHVGHVCHMFLVAPTPHTMREPSLALYIRIVYCIHIYISLKGYISNDTHDTQEGSVRGARSRFNPATINPHAATKPGVANVTEIVDDCYKYCYARNASNRRARPSTKRKYQMITFNTGRNYTEHGQRIAAQRVASGAADMIDSESFGKPLAYVVDENGFRSFFTWGRK